MKTHRRRQTTRKARGGIAWLASVLVLAAAQQAHAEPKQGQTYGDWQVQCPVINAKTHETRCNLFQNVSLKDSRQTVLQVAVGYLPKVENPLMLITLPLGIWLPPGALIDIDRKQVKKLPFDRCGQDSGCLVGFEADNALQAKLKAGSVMHVTFRDSSHRPITLPVSLAGIGAGLEALRGLVQSGSAAGL
jgi:invasion protein IalB